MNNRIALFIPTLHIGGAEKVIINLAKGLKTIGYEIDLLVIKEEGGYKDDIPKDINIVNLNCKRAILSVNKIARYFKKNKPKALISAMGHCNVAAIIGGIIAKENTKIIVTIHTTLSRLIENTKGIKSRAGIMANINAQKIFYKKAYKVLAVSEEMARDASEILELESIETIYNPVISNEIIEKANDKVDVEYINNKSMPVILSVGRLTEAKNFDVLIKSFAKVLEEGINCRLLILGEGEKRNELEKLINKLGIKDKVDMPGFSNNPYSYMSKCDVFVLPSKWEGLPTVLIEAMACGMKVVSTDCKSGPSEILDNGKYGQLVKVGDDNDMSKAIISAINNEYKHNDYNRHLEKFTFENVLEKYIDIIEK